MKWRISGLGYKHLTRFSRLVQFKPAASSMQRLTLSAASNFVTEGLFIYIYLKKIIKIGFPELQKKILQRFCSFSTKGLLKYWSLAVPNGSRIEYLCNTIPKAQTWLVLNLPVFMFVYIHFNVPPTRITDLMRNVSDEKIYYRYRTVTFVYVLLLSTWFVFSQL